MGRPRKKDLVRPGYKDAAIKSAIPRKATWEGFQERTPAEIIEECRKIREGWSEAERRSRAVDPALREDVNSWTVPVIYVGNLECSVEGVLPMQSAPLDVIDELDPGTPGGERGKCAEDIPPWVSAIVLNKARRKAG